MADPVTYLCDSFCLCQILLFCLVGWLVVCVSVSVFGCFFFFSNFPPYVW